MIAQRQETKKKEPILVGPITVPVLFLVFNRPDTTARVFETIRQARPPRLYVGADGPRAGREGEAARCEEVRRIATAVDWPCEVNTLFRDDNLGCKIAISEAINWFFGKEEKGIILEDDCLPDHTFFRFCNELLIYYEHDDRIMTISGNNFLKNEYEIYESYYFSKHFSCWGWASWRRSWNLYDRDLNNLDSSILRGVSILSDGNPYFKSYWKRILNDCRQGINSSWAYPMSLSCFYQYGLGKTVLNVFPKINMVSNIGFGENATHTTDTSTNLAQSSNSLRFPLVHPDEVRRNFEADRFTDLVRYNITISNFIIGEIGYHIPWIRRIYRRLKKKI